MKLTVDASLYLERLELKHAGELYALADLNSAYLGEWMPWIQQMKGIDFIENFISKSIQKNNEKTEQAFAIFLNNIMVGRIGLYKIDNSNQLAEIGYWLAESQQGKGLIKKSCERLITFAFEACELNRLEIKCAVKNIKSQNIPKKLGFTFEGNLRSAEKIRDEFHDLNLYSLLKKDWNKNALSTLR
ncbi:MAG: GNAT family N-acetyltransferase [Bacteroidetes bacterium]|nr:GNAT family N-acetyltransferase [Bacteroidota bacterium]